MRMPEDHESQDERELQAPPELVAALKRVSQERVFVPPTVDEAILRAAERHLAQPERRWFAIPVLLSWISPGRAGAGTARPRLRRGHMAHRTRGRAVPAPAPHAWLKAGIKWLAASAAVGMVVLLGFYLATSGLRGARGKTGQMASTTGPGVEKQVDILDAFALAKRLQTGPVREPRWDINGDGKVDERDVQALAAQAVRLDNGGHS